MSEDIDRLRRLAVLFAELAEAADDIELDRALGLCLGFADRLIRDRAIDETPASLPRGCERTETLASRPKRSPLGRLN
jgi:hypothetical protein